MDKQPLVSIVDDSESVRESLPGLLRHVGFSLRLCVGGSVSRFEVPTRLMFDPRHRLPGMSGPIFRS